MAAEVKKEVSFDVFGQLDFRAGTILKVEDVEKSTKLTKLTVDLGEEEPRTIICSLREVREDYKTVEGKQALFLVNLAPRKIMGIESHGMLAHLVMMMELRIHYYSQNIHYQMVQELRKRISYEYRCISDIHRYFLIDENGVIITLFVFNDD